MFYKLAYDTDSSIFEPFVPLLHFLPLLTMTSEEQWNENVDTIPIIVERIGSTMGLEKEEKTGIGPA
jgi:hypothetical protein